MSWADTLTGLGEAAQSLFLHRSGLSKAVLWRKWEAERLKALETFQMESTVGFTISCTTANDTVPAQESNADHMNPEADVEGLSRHPGMSR
jgi:hypothetical protein